MAEFNGWKVHDGSDECPVPDGTMGQVLFKDESFYEVIDAIKAGVDDISSKGRFGASWYSAFAYRTVKEPVETTSMVMYPRIAPSHYIVVRVFDDGTVTAEVNEVK